MAESQMFDGTGLDLVHKHDTQSVWSIFRSKTFSLTQLAMQSVVISIKHWLFEYDVKI